MRTRWLSAFAVLTVGSPALAQEVGATATTTAPATAAPLGHADTFASANGQYGAGISISGDKTLRAYGELGVYSFDFFNITLWHFSAITGIAYKLQPDIELEGMLPLALFNADGPGVDEQGAAVGNLHLGASYVGEKTPVRFKVGGAVEWAPWTIDPGQNFGLALGFAPYAYALHDIGLWAPEVLTLVAPGHVEFGDQFVGTGDGAIGLHIPTDGGDVEMSVQIDPGFGYYVNETALVGARLPFIWIPTQGGDNAQLAIEPYGRLDFGKAFVNARFTLNLDEPIGFGFDEGEVWSIHFGGGGSF